MSAKTKVSTSTNICNHILWDKEVYTSEDAIRMIAAGGYDTIDLDLAFWRLQEDHMAKDNWREWLDRQIDTAAAVGLPMTQGHAHFYNAEHCELLSAEEQEHRDQAILRDIEAAGLCGIRWLVVHPQSYCDDVWYSKPLSMQKNLEMFKRLGDAGAKHGVGIAVENMFIRTMPKFGASSDDLVELVDALGDDQVFGICWDTGHGNLNRVDQAAAVLQMGKRLKCLHVNDNKGQWDDHILPYHGTIQWESFMKALGKIGYEGEFTYEIHNFSKGFDAGFHQEAVTFARKLAQYMVTLMD